MSIFGYDRDVVDRAMAEASTIMTGQQAKLQEMAREVRRLTRANNDLEATNARLERRSKELEADVRREQREANAYEHRAEQAEALAERCKAELDGAREDRDQRLRELGHADRNVARLERRVHELETQNERLEDRVARAEFALDDERERYRQLENKHSEAKGLLEGLMLRLPAEAAEAAKEVREGQAALMRGRKKSLSPKAKLKALKQAESKLGELPDDARKELRRLEAELEKQQKPDEDSDE